MGELGRKKHHVFTKISIQRDLSARRLAKSKQDILINLESEIDLLLQHRRKETVQESRVRSILIRDNLHQFEETNNE